MLTGNECSRLKLDLDDGLSEFAREVIAGLSKPRKTLPCRFLYDARGSELFESITRLPEYYPTRTEAAILAAHACEMVEGIGSQGVLIEFGSGSSLKTEFLLRQLPPGVIYVPIDVSETALSQAKQRLVSRFPSIKVHPIVGDFTEPIELPATFRSRPRTGFFPGSTIGNLTPNEALHQLTSFRTMLPTGSRLIIGVDLKKDARRLVVAYNDAIGITAEFNRNILIRINRELGSAIDIASFQHEAIYNPREGRIEMHLVSVLEQKVQIIDRRFQFRAGESIHTENSYKYSVAQFQSLARSAGWNPSRVWTDVERQFSVHELRAQH